jgi:hypothetical protein
MRKIKVPNPKALPGDEVHVKNYRTNESRFERGIVTSAEYYASGDGSGWWHYGVNTLRTTPRVEAYGRIKGGRPITLYVSDDGIRI